LSGEYSSLITGDKISAIEINFRAQTWSGCYFFRG